MAQRPALVQNQEATATATPSPLDPDTAAVITSIGAQPVASYYNAIKTLQSMFEVNDGVTINPNGSAQTRFQVTPQVRDALESVFSFDELTDHVREPTVNSHPHRHSQLN